MLSWISFVDSSLFVFFFSSRRRHTRCSRDWSSDVCSSDLPGKCSGGAKPATGKGLDRAHERITRSPSARRRSGGCTSGSARRSEERREGKSVDLGGRGIIKKKSVGGKRKKSEDAKIGGNLS